MKKAIIYKRVSTDEQAEKGYSLQAQESKLVEYCRKNGIEVVKLFTDDFSAKTGFDRPGFNALNEFIGNNKKENIDLILVTQWTRFSRNLVDALVEIERLKKIRVQVNAIEQWVDTTVAESLYLLSTYLSTANVENLRLSERTKTGMRQAQKQGRWLWKAPYGYMNDIVNKLIVPDERYSDIIKYAFQTFITGVYSAEEVWMRVRERGLPISKHQFYDMLRNPFYAGKIKIDAWKEEPEQIVEGLHEALVSEETIKMAQAILSGKKKSYASNVRRKEELQLRGFLRCDICGRQLTGSRSRSRNQSLHYYYHHSDQRGCKQRFRAETANNKFIGYLKDHEITQEAQDLYYAILEDVFKLDDVQRDKERNHLNEQINALQKRLDNLNDHFNDRLIQYSDYINTKNRYETSLNELILKHATFAPQGAAFKKYVSYSLSLMADIGTYYENAEFPVKQKIIGSIFPEKLIFNKESYRTTKMNEIFGLISSTGKGFKNKQPDDFVKLSSVAPRSGLEPETL